MSLWGEYFEENTSEQKIKKIIDKINNPKSPKQVSETVLKSNKITLEDKLNYIYDNVLSILGVYKDSTEVIKDIETFREYIDTAISNGIIAIDTETNKTLDYLNCKLMGLCLYTPGMKNAYIPVNHIDNKTGKKLDWQITEEQIFAELNRLGNTKIIVHNGKFDYQVLFCTTSYKMPMYWDTMIGAKLLDENEKSAGLKQQYIDKIDPSIEKYSIEHFFKEVNYEQVDPDIFALYAATDSYMTYKLYEWQKRKFELPGCEKLLDLFLNIEMPIVEVSAEMELTGICLDMDYQSRLSAKYHKKLDSLNEELYSELRKLDDKIEEWRKTPEANYAPIKNGKASKSKNEQLGNPINLSSSTQLAILLYDVLKIEPVNSKSPRSVDKNTLPKIKIPLTEALLKYRIYEKMTKDFIDKLPEVVNPKDNRVHAHFNQMGGEEDTVRTGRFSCSEPNLQQIPSHDKSVRMIFKATEGYKLVGADFSQQEPRLLSYYAQDDRMIGAYKNGRDLYATIASSIYHNKYEDNLEHYPDGSLFVEGKSRRSSCKSLLLGIMYGMGAASIASRLGLSMEDAQKIIDGFYNSYPKVKSWMDNSKDFAYANGYVEDLFGRRRRLPEMQMPKYEVKYIDESKNVHFNPILGAYGKHGIENKQLKEYEDKLKSCKGFKDINAIKKVAKEDGVSIIDNSGFISKAERQCVNARIQGGAASMTKLAMKKVYLDDELSKLGFRMLLVVHDEIIGECPEENAERCAELLSSIMKNCVSDIVNVPFKCDATITRNWYEDEVQADISETASVLKQSGKSKEEIIDIISEDREEFNKEEIIGFIADEL